MSQLEWEFFEECFNNWCATLPLPDLVIFLDAPFEVLRERIQERNRSYEVDTCFSYLKSVELGVQSLQKKLTQLNVPAAHIQVGDKSPTDVVQEVYDAIKR